ncbi:hypothetical protein F4677DRAFT_407214 [Hypoxylon crocopeplum]|nr:hypothetical protein F4677DRAFT_407214 [Hypoxylon crocopeplum]
MMDPISAAGLASSIITFVDFTIKFAKLAKQVHEAHGALPADLRQCQSILDEFSQWIRNLQTRQATSPQADRNLSSAIDHCVEDCNDLLDIFQAILPSTGQRQGKLVSLKTAVKALRSEGRIKRVQKSLETHKNELRLRIAERTMVMMEKTIDNGTVQLASLKTVQGMQLQNHKATEQSLAEVSGNQRHHSVQIRRMHNDLVQYAREGRQDYRTIGDNLEQLYHSGNHEVLACVAQSNHRISEVQNTLGLVEFDLDAIKSRGDETLLLVKQLASVVNDQTKGSSAIYIRIPQNLYNPALSVWSGYRAYIEKSKQINIPGAWKADRIDHALTRRPVQSSGQVARAMFLTVSGGDEVGQLTWTRHVIAPDWRVQDFKKTYRSTQSWLSYLLCYQMVAVKAVPVIRQSKADSEDATVVFRTWVELLDQSMNASHSAYDLEDRHRADTLLSFKPIHRDFMNISTVSSVNKLSSSSVSKNGYAGRFPPSFSGDLTQHAHELLLQTIEEKSIINSRRKQREISSLIKVNQELLGLTDIPEHTNTIQNNIRMVLERFNRWSGVEMTELVQMMTTTTGSEEDREGTFKWGFMVQVSRNMVHFQLLLFVASLLLVWIAEDGLHKLAQLAAQYLGAALCAPGATYGWLPFLAVLRIIFVWFAVEMWSNHHDYLVKAMRLISAPNLEWEKKLQGVRSEASLTVRHFVFGILAFIEALSCLRFVHTLIGSRLEQVLYLAWTMSGKAMMVISLWQIQDWFRLHNDVSLRVYSLGTFLAIVVFLCAF